MLRIDASMKFNDEQSSNLYKIHLFLCKLLCKLLLTLWSLIGGY